MKTISKILSVALLTSSILFTSCGKYEDGPKISLASKKGRLTRKWTVEKYIDGKTNVEYTCNNNCTTYELKKDESVIMNGSTWTATKWQLSKDKEKLEYVTTVGNVITTYSSTILRLTSKELWTKDDVNGTETHFKGD